MAKIKFEKFSNAEIRDIAIIAIVIGFVSAFSEWSYVNLAYKSLSAFLILLASVSVQKIFASKVGSEAEFKMRWEHLVIMAVLAFFTNGVLTALLVPAVKIKPYFGRIGYKFNTMSLGEKAVVHIWMPLMFILVCLGAKTVAPFSPVAAGIVQLSSAMAFFSILPFPTLSGMEIFISHRISYVLLFFNSIILYFLGFMDFGVTLGTMVIISVILFLLGQKIKL
ncbi:MAG: hypothetical protein PHW96_00085 [Candidatus Nanoarchaeia archaeon]|nr:hypothetical protein [Candidatus Nanoarchaeia archaeon]